jgi:hypothetical protein
MLNDDMQGCEGTVAEIGGYFGLDLPCYPDLYPDALKYQSGRAAIRAVIEYAGIERVMVPAYVCDSVIKAVVDSRAAIEIYALDEALYPKDLPRRFSDRSVVLYVNYFGLCRKNIQRLLGEFPRDRLIIDNSQALFAPHEDVLATVYSPRKFVGVPDGGLLKIPPSLKLVPPAREDPASIERMRSLLVRLAYSAREGYADFQKIALSLKDTTPLGMSRLTQRLMKSIPWDRAAERRRKNFLAIAQKLDTINEMGWELGERDVPMCYPLSLRGGGIDRIRTELAARNIFVPVYWQDALPRIKSGSIEDAMTSKTLFLPIDQRLECAQVESVADLILQLLGKS